jgi:hypothetical protein
MLLTRWRPATCPVTFERYCDGVGILTAFGHPPKTSNELREAETRTTLSLTGCGS